MVHLRRLEVRPVGGFRWLASRLSGSSGWAVRATVKATTLSGAMLALVACAAPVGEITDREPGILESLPEQVAALAAPYQDIQAVRIRPEDGCYWYRHVGPVETTMLPLRTVDGRPICTGRVQASD
jgi:hypothetical protein